jgi:hypothetical protein
VAHDLKIMLFFIASTLWMSYNSIGNSILWIPQILKRGRFVSREVEDVCHKLIEGCLNKNL